MKKIEAVLDLLASDDLQELLAAAGVAEAVVDTVKKFAAGNGHTQRYRGVEYRIDYRPKIRIEFVVEDWACEPALRTLCTALRRNGLRDGAVTVVSCEAVPINPRETALATKEHYVSR